MKPLSNVFMKKVEFSSSVMTTTDIPAICAPNSGVLEVGEASNYQGRQNWIQINVKWDTKSSVSHRAPKPLATPLAPKGRDTRNRIVKFDL